MSGNSARRILLVDDAAVIRETLSRILVAAGYVVQTAMDGLGAIAKLRDGLPDLTITDLKMPRMSGHEFLKVVRHRFPRMPVIVLSGDAHLMRELEKDVHAEAFLPKQELRYEDLLRLVAELVDTAPARNTASHLDSQPVQVNWDSDDLGVVACTECLRSFKLNYNGKTARIQRTVACAHCGGLLRLSVENDNAEGAGIQGFTNPSDP